MTEGEDDHIGPSAQDLKINRNHHTVIDVYRAMLDFLIRSGQVTKFQYAISSFGYILDGQTFDPIIDPETQKPFRFLKLFNTFRPKHQKPNESRRIGDEDESLLTGRAIIQEVVAMAKINQIDTQGLTLDQLAVNMHRDALVGYRALGKRHPLSDLPQDIQTAELHLTSLRQAQSFISQQEKIQTLAPSLRKRLISELELDPAQDIPPAVLATLIRSLADTQPESKKRGKEDGRKPKASEVTPEQYKSAITKLRLVNESEKEDLPQRKKKGFLKGHRGYESKLKRIYYKNLGHKPEDVLEKQPLSKVEDKRARNLLLRLIRKYKGHTLEQVFNATNQTGPVEFSS